MPRRESAWSVVNVRWDGAHSQLSIWNPERGLPIFRSWVTYEDGCPSRSTRSRPTAPPGRPWTISTRSALLKRSRGRGGVWLAGLYMDDADSHESAVRSAVAIARELAPDSARLHLLEGKKKPPPVEARRGFQWLRRASIP